MSQGTYALDNAQPGAGMSLSWLAQAYDLNTMTILEPLIPRGGRCIELGAGTGTVARRMAERAGSRGLVVAADLDPQHLTPDPNVRVVQHDLRTDPLAALDMKDPDLIHGRCVLAHLRERDDLVPRYVDWLRPGGHLVIEDMGGSMVGEVLHSPYDDTTDLLAIYQSALIKMFRAAGNDPAWAARTHEVMVRAGLQEVRTFVFAQSWRGGTAGCRLVITLSTQVEEKLLAHGATVAQLAELRRQLSDPEVVILGNPMWSTVGQKPAEG